MLSIIICALLLCTAIMVITQGRDILTMDDNKNMNVRMFFYLCLFAMVNNICHSGMMVMEQDLAYECLAAIAWCTNIAFMGVTVYLLAYLLDTEEKRTQIYTSIILYLGIIFYIVDIMLKGGMRHVERLYGGQKYESVFALTVMTVLCLLYVYFIVAMVYSYRNRRSRRRERVIFQYIMVVCTVTILSRLIEVVLHLLGYGALPINSLSMVVTAWCLKKAYICHEMLEIRREDYEEALEANSHEPVVICDDEGKVVFINKCAVISVVDEKESVIGKKLIDLFEFKESEKEVFFAPHTGVFTVSGTYRATGRRCNLTIQNVYDTYGEIFTNIITIYRIENINPLGNQVTAAVKEGQTVQSIPEVVDVTRGANILIVDDSPSALASLEEAMKVYEMNVEKAYSGEDAIALLESGRRYDMIFIDHMMPEIDGIGTTKHIRSMEGEYYVKVPIVFCTVTSIEENLSEFLKVRFNDFLHKPIEAKQLSDILARWLWNRATDSAERAEAEEEKILKVALIAGIQQIDEKVASKYIGDNEKMYIALLQNFQNDMKEMIQDLEACYEHFDRMRFRIFTHAMGSACKGIGAVKLSERALALEQACMSEDSQYIMTNMPEYLKDFRTLVSEIEEHLKHYQEEL